MAGRLQDDDDISETHEINVTPFIDVMLVLLIIFMVVAPLSTVDVPVELPVSAAAPAAKPDQATVRHIEGRPFPGGGQRHGAVERARPGARCADEQRPQQAPVPACRQGGALRRADAADGYAARRRLPQGRLRRARRTTRPRRADAPHPAPFRRHRQVEQRSPRQARRPRRHHDRAFGIPRGLRRSRPPLVGGRGDDGLDARRRRRARRHELAGGGNHRRGLRRLHGRAGAGPDGAADREAQPRHRPARRGGRGSRRADRGDQGKVRHRDCRRSRRRRSPPNPRSSCRSRRRSKKSRPKR